jgi:hypothetical protein
MIAAGALCGVALVVHAQQSVTTDAGTITAEQVERFFKEDTYSPYAGRNFPDHPLWGDQHLHTSWSPDAVGGGTRLGPEEAYRFARGEEVVSSTGQKVRLARPLDWLAVSDHSDAMGVVADVIAGKPELMTDPQLKKWHQMTNAGADEAMKAVMEMITLQGQGELPKAMTDPNTFRDVWRRYTAIAEKYNEPGRFTAMIGYEWTSNYGGGNNLHRNIMYRDGKTLADQVLPLTTFDTENPEKLWEWMQGYEDETGGRVLAIPHNGNLSNGMMFAVETFAGEPLTRDWADTRMKWERLYEVTQGKGTSEQHPSLAPNDEFADFEIWDKGNLNVVPKKPGMIDYEYAREAYKHGLEIENELGANPFKFGLAGGTDAHTGLTAAEENNFFGKFPSSEPSAERWDEDAFNFDGRVIKGWELGASGYTAVWATENTREAIWDAMHRKETYATTGPRILVRFFGGFEFTDDDAYSRQPAEAGYAKGVPMGGDLANAPQGKAPSFLVAALKDSLSGNLDRIQIIKGWLDASGHAQERIYDVAVSDGRSIDADGRCSTPVGNTVNLERATWTNTIGDPELITVWTDPDFDPSLPAFYYARVIEIPTPRWTAFDAFKYKIEMGEDVPMTVQERAYTSPIWYTPAAEESTLADTAQYDQNSWQQMIPPDCFVYFDGCNTCRRNPQSGLAACTRKACMNYNKPYCLDQQPATEASGER